MSIYLLSLSHKSTPLEVRSLFSYTEEQKEQVLRELLSFDCIEEAVLISTCNRMEIYCYGQHAMEQMERVAIKVAGAEVVSNMGQYIRRYQKDKAVHHLFQVVAGLDSAVIGEDQILGQVKESYDFSHERGFTGVYLNTLFRHAVTAAKRVKTDTLLSKTSVSTASLAIKAAEKKLDGLAGKKVMIIGATGKIGNIVLKNLNSMQGIEIFVTMRNHAGMDKLGHGAVGQMIPFEERYQWMNQMDVVVSATTSPHYTLTTDCVLEQLKTKKQRVFLDLAVPLDIEESIGETVDNTYYNMSDMTELARQNNEKKQAEIQTAEKIMEEYESQFFKWFLFQTSRSELEQLKETMVQEACEKGIETAINHLIYRLREASDVMEWNHTLEAIKKVNQERTKERPRRKKVEQKAYFPLFFNLEGREVLMVGAGKIASRRAEVLVEFGAKVTVIAPKGAETMERLWQSGKIKWEKRVFIPSDVEGKYIVFTATNQSKLNTDIAVLCKAEQTLVNNAGDKSQCDFYFPGIAREGSIVAGITTSGKDHSLARELTGQMQVWLKQFEQ